MLQTFESIPQRTNNPYEEYPELPPPVWWLSICHILNDISIEYRDEAWIVNVSKAAFVPATPLLAEIDGVRGRYFSKRLHHAVVRFVPDDGTDRRALERILENRYAVSIRIRDYTELIQHTTQEHAGNFQEFKSGELIAIALMLEEFRSGMITTPGLKYLVEGN